MKKAFVTFLIAGWMVAALAGSYAQAFEIITQEMMEKKIVTRTDLIRTADNFIILFDASSSANKMVPGGTISRIQAAKNLLTDRNAWLPDLGYTAGLFTLTSSGHEPLYPLLPYDRASYGAAIEKLPETGSGPTMIQPVLRSLRKPIEGLSGKTAIILFTDGSYNKVRGPKAPLQIAQEIASDNDVCFYLVSSATDAENKQMLEALSKVNACSRVVPLNRFLDNPQYLSGALFTVKTTVYENIVPVTMKIGVAEEDVLFDFDSIDIRGEYNEKLGQLADFLQRNPETFCVLAGYTDSTGGEEYNLALSERRSAQVKSHLVNKHGIDADRIVTLWFGTLNPVKDNTTAEGRQRNRRVEVAVGGIR